MNMKKRVKWWKAVLLGAASLLFLWMFAAILPVMFDSHSSFIYIAQHAGLHRVELYSERATMYYGYLCMELFNGSGAAIALYCLFRCFYPAKMSAKDTNASVRCWRRVTYVCLTCFIICIMLLFLYRRTHVTYDYGIANGGEWTTATDLIIPGWIGIGLILSMDGTVFSVIRRRELKQLPKQGE